MTGDHLQSSKPSLAECLVMTLELAVRRAEGHAIDCNTCERQHSKATMRRYPEASLAPGWLWPSEDQRIR